MRQARAVGVIRVSRIKGRDKKQDGEGFHSPEVQRGKIEALRARHGWRLAEIHDENENGRGSLRDASGAKPLAQRPKLLAAVEAVEQGRADVLAVAYADRLTWTQRVRDEVLERVERAGGEVWAEDHGRLSNGTAVEEFSGTTLTAAARFVRRQAAEKARAAQVEAVENGTWMAATAPLGYLRGPDRRLAPDPESAPLVVEAFERRAAGASYAEVRDWLAEHGIERTRTAVRQLLTARTYLGELHFGDLVNPAAHEAIVPADLFRRVRRTSVTSGPRPPSDRLLARLGVLRCGCCGARMSATSQRQHGRVYGGYRCRGERCERQQQISAPLVERVVVEQVRVRLAGVEGHADAEAGYRRAAEQLERADRAYRAAVEALDPTEPAEVERLREFRAARDAAQERLDALQESLPTLTRRVTGADWDELDPSERRDLVRTFIERVDVLPGRGAERVVVVPKGAEAVRPT